MVTIKNPTKKVTVYVNDNPDANTSGAVFNTNTITASATFNGWSSNQTNLGLGNNATTGTTKSPTTAWNDSTKTTNIYFKNLRNEPGTVTLVANWDEPTIQIPTITKTGYTCGWTTTPTGTTIEHASGANYKLPQNTSKTTIYLYAFCKNK